MKSSIYVDKGVFLSNFCFMWLPILFNHPFLSRHKTNMYIPIWRLSIPVHLYWKCDAHMKSYMKLLYMWIIFRIKFCWESDVSMLIEFILEDFLWRSYVSDLTKIERTGHKLFKCGTSHSVCPNPVYSYTAPFNSCASVLKMWRTYEKFFICGLYSESNFVGNLMSQC
jgi:hypothetical protein